MRQQLDGGGELGGETGWKPKENQTRTHQRQRLIKELRLIILAWCIRAITENKTFKNL